MLKKILLTLVTVATLSAGAFELEVLPTAMRNVVDQWNYIVSGGGPTFSKLTSAYVDENYITYVFISNAAADAEGMSRLEMDLCGINPQGTITYEEKNLPLIEGKLQPKTIYLSPTYIGAFFEKDDTPGVYTTRITARDLVDNSEVVKEVKITLNEPEPMPTTAMPKDEFDKYVMTYYQNPKPHLLLSAYARFLEHDLEMTASEKSKNYRPENLLAFFYFALQGNPFLIPEFAAYVNADHPRQAQYSQLILRSLDHPDSNPFVFDRIENLVQMDILWMEFFVVGNRKPLLMLIDLLKYGKDAAPPQKDAAVDPKYLLYNVARWSLKSNIGRHFLLIKYVDAMLKRNEISDEFTRIELNNILTEIIDAIKAQQQPQEPTNPDVKTDL